MENIGNTTLKFLEIFKSGMYFSPQLGFLKLLNTLTDRFQDISLTQWLALTPPAVVKAHLGFSEETIRRLSKTKQEVV